MTEQQQQEQITNTEWIIDLEKFDKRIEKYVSKDTFCTFSSTDLKDTLDEIRTIVYNCIERRERSRPAPATPKTRMDVFEAFIGDHLKEHDAAIREQAKREERKKVLGVFAEVEYLHDVDGITYPDLYNEFIQRYKSLRSTTTAKKRDTS